MNKTETVVKFAKIVQFMEKYGQRFHGNVTVNKDFTVDVDGNVYLRDMDLYKIPFQFGKVKGWFDICGNKLTSLKGCPRWVGNTFSCNYNQLTSLEGISSYIGYNLHCEYNPQLKSLKGIGRVGGFIYSDFYKGKLKDYNGEL